MKWNYETNLPIEGTFKRRGLLWDEFFLTGKHHKVSNKEWEDVTYHMFWDAYYACADSDPMKPFFIDYQMSCFYYIELDHLILSHWRNHSGSITTRDTICRFYFCETETDFFDLVLDCLKDPREIEEVFAEVTKKDPLDVIPFTASLERLNRFTSYYKKIIIQNNPITMKRLDTFSNIIDGKEVKGRISFLHPKGISVSIDRPFKCTCGSSITKEQMLEHPLAMKKNGEYVTTSAGTRFLLKLHRVLYKEARYLVDHKEKVQEMIEAIISKQEPIPTYLQREYFPEIHHFEMDLEYLDSFATEILKKDYDLVGLFYPSFRRNPEALNLKQGDLLSVIVDGFPVNGRVEVLTRKAICVSLDSPIECFAERHSDEGAFADKIDGTFVANADGVKTARELLGALYEQSEYLAEHKKEMDVFINEYLARKEHKQDILRSLTMKDLQKYKETKEELDSLLPNMREHYLPLITELELDEAFLKSYSEKILGLTFDTDITPIDN